MTDFTKELLFGMRPVRRTNPQPGESEWYYLDPRGADTFDSMNHIDVESETSPNPYAGEIQNYLYKNDPYNYKQLYGNTPPPVQNTQSTMNTTSASGQQMSSASDDYQRAINNYEQANTVGSFMSGTDNNFSNNKTEYNEISMLQNQTPAPWNYNEPQTTPTPWSTTTSTPTPWNHGVNNPQQMTTPTPWNKQTAQICPVPWRNNQTITPWAGGYDLSVPAQRNSNYISDEDLYARMWNNIKEQEGIKLHPYLDTKGLITIGGGANVNDWNVFKNLNVTVDGVPATEAQKREAYNRMRQLSDEKDTEGNFINRNMKAKFFENKTDIRISDAEARGLAQNHMTNDLTHLRNEFSDFDSFPLPLKEVLLDIQYNVKGGVNQNDWPNLYQAIRNRDINSIVDNVNRKDVQQERNDWAKRTARSIRF